MKSNLSFALVALAVTGALSSCGGSSSSASGTLQPALTGDQKSQIAAFMQATNRASDAPDELAEAKAGTQITVNDGGERQMISTLQSRSCAITGTPPETDLTQPSGSIMTFTVGGADCPISLSQKFTVQTVNQSGVSEFHYQSLDPTYSALNDIDEFSGQFVTTVSGTTSPQTTTMNQQASLHSQKLGQINFTGKITSTDTFASDFSVNDSSGEAKVHIQFPQFSVDFREEQTGAKGVLTTQYFVNGQPTSAADYKAIVSTTFLGDETLSN